MSFSFWPDLINGVFEISGGFFVLISVIKLRKEKSATGVHWLSFVFFTAWGLWNLYYYPFLEQWISFYGGVWLVIVNFYYSFLIVKYSKRRIT